MCRKSITKFNKFTKTLFTGYNFKTKNSNNQKISLFVDNLFCRFKEKQRMEKILFYFQIFSFLKDVSTNISVTFQHIKVSVHNFDFTA